MPSDYRYDPFNNIAEPINITGETHVIPSNSPYTIRLKEVPVKESPSTVTLTIGGIAATEVAAEPAAGEFWPDYSTSADGDNGWNTGTILFNSADAGKIVAVSYNGMGSLASTNAPSPIPTWAKYRGDGSDGDFVAVGGETLSGLKQYSNFTIGTGKTVNVGTEPLVIFCTGTVTIDGTLNGKGKQGNGSDRGYTAVAVSVGGSGKGDSTDGDGFTGAGLGSGGGSGGGSTANNGISLFDNIVVASNGASPSSVFQNYMAQFLLKKAGAGGLAGYQLAYGGGGGTIILASTTIAQNGTLNVAGGLKYSSGTLPNRGGGSGGASITIVARNIVITGIIDVSGGNGYGAQVAGGANGGAGWYKIFTAGA